MNMNQIINMVMRQLMRRGVNAGINRGIGMIGRSGKRADDTATDETDTTENRRDNV